MLWKETAPFPPAMPTPPSDPLDPLLQRWGRSPRCHPPLRAEVRQRLSEGAEDDRATLVLFSRPAFATLFLAACVLLGLFLAEVRVSRLHRERDQVLLESYRRLIDPLLTVAPAPPNFAKDQRT